MSESIQALWKQFCELNPTNENLFQVMHDNEGLRNEAWKLLLEKGATEGDLIRVARYIDGDISKEARRLFFSGTPSNERLCHIIEHFPGRLRDEAWQKLLTQHPTSNDLFTIVCSVKELRNEAWELLLASDPEGSLLAHILEKFPILHEVAWEKFRSRPRTNKELMRALRFPGFDYCTPLRDEAWKMFLAQNPTLEELLLIIKNDEYEFVQQRAWEELRARTETNEILCGIMIHVKEFRQAAWERLLEIGPREDDLKCLIKWVEPLQEEAKEAMKSLNEQSEIIMKMRSLIA